MGTPIPNKQREAESSGAGPLTVTTFDQLDPKTQEELRKRYGIKIGEQASGDEASETKAATEVEKTLLTKEVYLQLSADNPDYKIANQFNMSTQALKRLKDEWGIPDRRLNPAKPASKDAEKPKGRPPGRPRATPPAEKVATESTELQAERQTGSGVSKKAELESLLQAKESEVSRLRAENEQLRDMYEQQIKGIQEASIRSFQLLLQDFIQFTFKTRNAVAADNARRTLQEMGADLDYRVRSGIIEVTTDVCTTEPILAPRKEELSHAESRVEN